MRPVTAQSDAAPRWVLPLHPDSLFQCSMCLCVPERIEEIAPNGTARARGPEGERIISLALLEGVSVGDYVTVQSGFAIRRHEAAEAEKVLALLREAGLASQPAPKNARESTDEVLP